MRPASSRFLTVGVSLQTPFLGPCPNASLRAGGSIRRPTIRQQLSAPADTWNRLSLILRNP